MVALPKATNSKSSDEGSTSSDHTAWMSPAESSHTVASEEFQEVLMENFSYKDRGASGEKDGFILEVSRWVGKSCLILDTEFVRESKTSMIPCPSFHAQMKSELRTDKSKWKPVYFTGSDSTVLY